MSLFSKPRAFLWPRPQSVDVYLSDGSPNTYSFDLNLWETKSEADLLPLRDFFHSQKIDKISLLLPDDVVLTKSFIYDSPITTIDPKEIVLLAQSFVNFEIDAQAIEYQLSPLDSKTIIRATIRDQKKLGPVLQNLATLGLPVTAITSVAASISKAISTVDSESYFAIYPLTKTEYVLLLARGPILYLTSIIKSFPADLQKIINYSHLYFSTTTQKFFIPQGFKQEINTTTKLDKIEYNSTLIAQKSRLPSTLPLPILGFLLSPPTATPAGIIDQLTVISSPNPKNTMEPKKSILPIVAVFIFTAAIASIILWFVFNRNSNSTALQNPTSQEETPAPTQPPVEPTVIPTAAPTMAATAVNKNLKIQVQNATSINGQAAILKADLVKLGFKNVATGNSAETLTENQIKTKAKYATYVDYFTSKLPNFVSPTTAQLEETSTYDIVLIIGTKLGAASTATPSPSLVPTR